MEVAGQWRREWAGTAEYGKVTEGGVTKRVARAMEVLNASAPGARVRVLRAAYHSTAGPGAPASSYTLQSSRRVISSGYDFVEPTSLPSKPLEISSLPLEMIDTDAEKQNYKVTEPDDLDISEPSKWRSGSGRSSSRLPSEESSSTDNASIIDLDSKMYRRNSFKNSIFKNRQDSTRPANAKNNRVSPLLDAPVTLSTLKYTSLLNGSDDWNNRRKSYSFEDTAPLNKIVLDKKDRFAIESSTDSGICKSSEIVNDIDSPRYHKPKDRKPEVQDETFKDWLNKNRLNLGGHSMKPVKEHSVTPDRFGENNITLQSSGKVCITLPVTIETERDYEYRRSQNSDENDRKSKKVEFCKTELHFAADTGTVNIIATDEKPPPTNDFRRRRSAFVPINDSFEKSVTLFGEKTDFHESVKTGYFSSFSTNDIGDSDENTAATKSILKNKIPKPKPYLLGENMILGNNDDVINIKKSNRSDKDSRSGVSLINTQLKTDKKYSTETSSDSTKLGSSDFTYNSYRTTNEGSLRLSSSNKLNNTLSETNKKLLLNKATVDDTSTSAIKKKLQMMEKSPVLGRSNTRQLRESDLMYFGVGKNHESTQKPHEENLSIYDKNNEQEEIFESVRLVRRVSNSICSSEIESDDAPEYENILHKTNYTPVPAPRLRIKYSECETKKGHLNSIEEQENDNMPSNLRRTRLRRQDTSNSSSRSISEPPKANKSRYKEQNHCHNDNSNNSVSLRMQNKKSNKDLDLSGEMMSQDSSSFYVNLKTKQMFSTKSDTSNDKMDIKRKPQVERALNINGKMAYGSTEHTKIQRNRKHDEDGIKKGVRRSDSLNSKNNIYDSLQSQKTRTKRTEKLVTPDLSHSGSRRIKNKDSNYDSNNKIREKDLKTVPKNHGISSLHRHPSPVHVGNIHSKKQDKTIKAEPGRVRSNEVEEKYDTKYSNHSLSNNTNLSNITHKIKPDVTLLKLKNKVPDKNHDPKKSRRSEYIINYDDKKGTVSSVRKIKPVRYASDIKNNPTKDNKENSNDHNVKIKQINKIALQKIPDQYGKGYNMKRASKAKTHAQKTCQLL